jgi:hypothetical protein
MAGKTLSGIGEDESGKHELAMDESGPSWRQDKTPSTRGVDRLPMSTIIGGPVPSQITAVQGPAVDEDKVAEGLKKLRSLDEPLGIIPSLPSSMPTLKEGIPAIGAAPTPVNLPPATAELIRSRGTAHGHALSAAARQGNLPISVDDRMKGTLLGHSLHLPDLPETTDENRRAEVLAIARPPASDAIVLEPGAAGFSHGDSQFFDSDPTINPEYEPENPRGKLIARGAIFLAVVSVFVVGAIAWVRVRKPDNPPMEVRATAPPSAGTAPSGLDNPGASAPVAAPANAAAAPGTAAPAEVPQPAAAAGAPAAVPGAAAPGGAVVPPPAAEAPTPPAQAAPEAGEAPPSPAPVRTRSRRHEAIASSAPVTKPPAPPTGHAVRPVGPLHETKPVGPGRRGKAVDDPDGTLPLSE